MGDRVTASLHFWLRLSLCFLIVRGLLSSFSWIAARRSMTAGKSTGVRATRSIMAAFWFTLGCAFISYHAPIKRLNDVLIIERRTDGSLRSIASGTGEFETITCYPNDFQPGEKFQYWMYENRVTCKDFRGFGRGFKAYTDADGNRIKFPIHKEIADVR